jgi:hypothetical protein
MAKFQKIKEDLIRAGIEGWKIEIFEDGVFIEWEFLEQAPESKRDAISFILDSHKLINTDKGLYIK